MSMDRKFILHRSPTIANLERRLFLKRAFHSARCLCSPAATSPTRKACSACCSRCRAGTMACRTGCSIRSASHRSSQRAASRARFRTTATIRKRSTGDRWFELQARARRHDPREEAWTLAELYALPQVSQVTRHICVEGWSAIGKWAACASRTSSPHRRRHHCEVRRFPVRRRLLRLDRHGDCAPSADAAQPALRRRATAAEVRLSDEAAHPDQARLQEPEAHRRHLRHQRISGGYWEDKGYNWYSGS